MEASSNGASRIRYDKGPDDTVLSRVMRKIGLQTPAE